MIFPRARQKLFRGSSFFFRLRHRHQRSRDELEEPGEPKSEEKTRTTENERTENGETLNPKDNHIHTIVTHTERERKAIQRFFPLVDRLYLYFPF